MKSLHKCVVFTLPIVVLEGCAVQPRISSDQGGYDIRGKHETSPRFAMADRDPRMHRNLDQHEAEEEEDGDEEEAPPGYWRTQGNVVPDWTYESQFAESGTGLAWTFLGPQPAQYTASAWGDVAGRVTALAPHPSNSSIAYAATSTGGLWKTTDSGVNWAPLTDGLSTMACQDVALDPSDPDTVYLLTGAAYGASGDGIFRSTDAGATWSQIATAAQVGAQPRSIAIDPGDPDILHVAGSIGCVRSVNGGSSWSTRLAGNTYDVAISPSDPDTLYVVKTLTAGGIYRSTDGGDSFTALGGGLPTTGTTYTGRIAIAPSDADTIYLGLQHSSSGYIYKSTDAGSTWASTGTSYSGGNVLTVHPTDPDTVYHGTIPELKRSTNGGTTWIDLVSYSVGSVHVDIFDVSFGPSNRLWVGCDGGVYRNSSWGATGSWTNCNADWGTTQHYFLGLHPSDEDQLITGMQDNGSNRRPSDTLSWAAVTAGDGAACCYDLGDPSVRYTSSQKLNIYRSSGSGIGGTSINGPWGPGSSGGDRKQFIAPFIIDPNTSSQLLAGTYRVWRTPNASAGSPAWTAISSDVTAGGSDTVTSLEVPLGSSATIYSGSQQGKLFVTTNDGSSWTDRSSGLVSEPVADIVAKPNAPQTAYVLCSETSGDRVFVTSDAGATWTNITGTFPSGVNTLAMDVDWRFSPPAVFVGTGAGLYHSFDHGSTWTKSSTFPNVLVGDVRIDRANNTLTVATFGRGVWRAPLPTPPASDCLATNGSTTGNTNAGTGVFFDLTPDSQDLRLTGIACDTFSSAGDCDVEVWTYDGSYVGHTGTTGQNDPASLGWTLHGTFAVTESGSSLDVDMSLDPVDLGAGQATGIWLKNTSSGGLRWRNSGVDNDWNDANLDLYSAHAKSGFNGFVYTSVNFTGTVCYDVLESSDCLATNSSTTGNTNADTGVFLDLTPASNNLRITGIECDTFSSAGNCDVEVWTYDGSYVGHTGTTGQNDPATLGWTLHDTYNVTESGESLDIDMSATPLEIIAGQATGIWLKNTSPGGLRWRNSGVDNDWNDVNVDLYSNHAKSGFNGFVYSSINFTGTVCYDVLYPESAGNCYADCDHNNTVDFFDVLCFMNAFSSDAGLDTADCDGSGSLDVFDILCFLNEFNVGCE